MQTTTKELRKHSRKVHN